ncbi:MFS transporter [Advenella sp. S44]|uniref:MFS transporter n=1 Tax=Advenella sp. S44 TaxID=1982755 RepID=UPI000C2ACDF4|nr:MFS transporter [Advenella sp. S44]PJX21022.1 MFS transporter [Advenella sp. S44]
MATTMNPSEQALPQSHQAIYRKVVWRLIPLLIICFIVAYYDRVNISFAKLQMQEDLGFSDTVYGLGASLFFVGYIIFEIPSNIILHRIGAKIWIARIMVSWGIASALLMFVQTPLHFYIGRFIIGAMEAGFLPGVVLYFTYWFPETRRARANSLFMIAISLAGVTGGPLAGWIMKHFAQINGWEGWQWLFLLEGLMAVVMGVAVYLCLSDKPATAKWLSDAEKKAIATDLAAEERSDHRKKSLLKSFSDPRLLYLALVYFLVLVGFGGVTFWMPQLIKNTGIVDAQTIGFLTSIPWLAGGIGMVFIGFNSDRTGERKWHLVFCAIASGLGYIVSAAYAQNPTIAIMALSVATLGILGIFPVIWTVPSTFLSGVAVASGIAFVNSVGNLGSIFSPTFIGWVNDLTHSTYLSVNVIGGLMILSGLFILVFWDRLLPTAQKGSA